MLMEHKREGKRRTSPAALEAERRRKERQAREKLQKHQWWALGIILVALALLNL